MARALGAPCRVTESTDAEQQTWRHPTTRPACSIGIASSIGRRPAVALPQTSAAAPPSSQPEPDWSGTAGKYLVDGVIEADATGTVRRARDPNLGRDVALKIMDAATGEDAALVARFVAEAQLRGRLQHPGVAPLYDLGEADGVAFYATKLVSGRTFAELLADRDDANRDRRRDLSSFEQVCQTIAYAHEQGAVHGNLTAASVIVGEFGEVQLVGWERASMVGTDDESGRRVDVVALGTILDQILGHGGADGTENALLELAARCRDAEDADSPVTAARLGAQVRQHLAEAEQQIHARRVEAAEGAARVAVARSRQRLASALIAVTALGLIAGLWLYRHADRQRTRAVQARDDATAAKGRAETALAAEERALRDASRALDERSDAYARLESTTQELARAVAEYRRTQDVPLAEELLLEAERELWPQQPSMVAAMDRWLTRARPLVERARGHRHALAAMQDPRDRFFARALSGMLEKVDRLDGADGVIAQVVTRRDLSATLERRSIEEHSTAWERVRARTRADERYAEPGGLESQLGLVPLGPDPSSGLEEFAVLDTGELPVRGADGELRLTDRFALVLVLIPGGTFSMGTDRQTARGGAFDKLALPWDASGRPVEVTLDWFLLSKYEMTRGQWIHLTGEDPSRRPIGTVHRNKRTVTARHPVDNVSHAFCEDVLAQVGLVLPTEAQWEYAARAGSTDLWVSGDEKATLQGAANLADKTLSRFGARTFPYELDLDDGYAIPAVVGTFPPNAFGLYNVIGNVSEHCQDWGGSYDVAAAPGTGLRRPEEARVPDHPRRQLLLDGRSRAGGPSAQGQRRGRARRRRLRPRGSTGAVHREVNRSASTRTAGPGSRTLASSGAAGRNRGLPDGRRVRQDLATRFRFRSAGRRAQRAASDRIRE